MAHSTVVKEFKDSGALHAHLAPFAFGAEGRFLTKTGDIGMALTVRGADYVCLTHEELDEIRRMVGPFALGCRFFLRDTGKKLAHLEKQLRSTKSISEELTTRIREEE